MLVGLENLRKHGTGHQASRFCTVGAGQEPFLLRLLHCLLLGLLAVALLGPGRTYAFETTHVIYFVIDGARDQEFLEQPGHANTPHIWNELRHSGYVSHSFYNVGVTRTLSGHGTMLTGTLQDLDYDPALRPDRPTIWEYYRDATGESANSCAIVSYKPKLSVETYSTYPGFGAPDSARFVGPMYSDIWVGDQWFQHAAQHNPAVSMLALGATDIQAHVGNWLAYNDAIRRADSLAVCVWNWVQSTPGWAGHTTMFITNDHGRHSGGPPATDWMNHADGCAGCRHVGLVAIGPDFVQGVEGDEGWSPNGDLRDLCCTAAALLGVPAPYTTGRVLWELFPDPSSVIGGPNEPLPVKLRLEAAPVPALSDVFIRLGAVRDGDLPAEWDLRLIDAGGRALRTQRVSREDLEHGLRVTRPAEIPGSGTAWLLLRSPGGQVASRRLLWVR